MESARPQEDLADLLRRSGEGDREAFTVLYNRTSAKLFGIICRILPSRELADEALQDCYLNIWRRAGSFDPEISSPVTWMATIARNRAIDIRRLGAERVSAGSDDALDELHSLDAGPHAAAERTEKLRLLVHCLEQLPRDAKDMILLAYFHGWSRQAISERLERPVNTVKTLLRRNLALLKGCLDGSE